MANFFITTAKKIYQKAERNPKKFFIYSMVFLTLSFMGSLVKDIFFPSNPFTLIRPKLYTKNPNNSKSKDNIVRDSQMEKIVNELKLLSDKRDKKELKKEDSLRIEFLFNQYQKLKNGH